MSMMLIHNNFSKYNLSNQSHKNTTLLSSNPGSFPTTRFQTNQSYHFQARRGMNTASSSGRGFLQITSKRILPNILKQKQKTLGYQKKLTFKAKIVPKVEVKPVDEGFLVTHIDLDWAHNYIVNNGLKFTPTTAKGWLLEYFKYSTHKQDGVRIIAH